MKNLRRALLILLLLSACGHHSKPKQQEDRTTNRTVPPQVNYDSLIALVRPDSSNYWAIDDSLLHSPYDIQRDSIAKYHSILSGIDRAYAPDKYLYFLGKLRRFCEPPDSNYAKRHASEYFYNEIGGDYLYNGDHFQRLLRDYPASDLADDDAYELTKLTPSGECEGHIECYIEWPLRSIKPFLRDYPSSPFIDDAVGRVNDAFNHNLQFTAELDSATEYYDPNAIEALLRDYSEQLEKLPPAARLKGYATTEPLWTRFHRYERACSQLRYIIEHTSDSIVARRCRSELAELGKVNFKLRPIIVIGYMQNILAWSRPPMRGITTFEVHRKTLGGTDTILVVLPPTTRTYIDTASRPDMTYAYRIKALAQSTYCVSNESFGITDRRMPDITDAFYNDSDDCLYLFGYLTNGFQDFYGPHSGTPEIIKVSADLQNSEYIHAAMWGTDEGRWGGPARHAMDKYLEKVCLVDMQKRTCQWYLRDDFRRAMADQGIDTDLFANVPTKGVRVSFDGAAVQVTPVTEYATPLQRQLRDTVTGERELPLWRIEVVPGKRSYNLVKRDSAKNILASMPIGSYFPATTHHLNIRLATNRRTGDVYAVSVNSDSLYVLKISNAGNHVKKTVLP